MSGNAELMILLGLREAMPGWSKLARAACQASELPAQVQAGVPAGNVNVHHDGCQAVGCCARVQP